MEILEHHSRIEVYSSTEELKPADAELLAHAKKATGSAYAPYSRFCVGAALRLEDGRIITGNNQENSAYPAGLCAERVALFYASANYPEQKILALAISASSGDFDVSEPITPCGSCRQVIAETENRQEAPVRILMHGNAGKVLACSGIEHLLPFMFMAEELKKTGQQ